MALRDSTHQADVDLFRQELVNMIDLRHELCALAAKIDWQALEIKFGGLYAAGVGRPGHPIRLMVGLQLLKFIRNRSGAQLAQDPHEAAASLCPMGDRLLRFADRASPSKSTGLN
jgi:transposase, IS5 family